MEHQLLVTEYPYHRFVKQANLNLAEYSYVKIGVWYKKSIFIQPCITVKFRRAHKTPVVGYWRKYRHRSMNLAKNNLAGRAESWYNKLETVKLNINVTSYEFSQNMSSIFELAECYCKITCWL